MKIHLFRLPSQKDFHTNTKHCPSFQGICKNKAKIYFRKDKYKNMISFKTQSVFEKLISFCKI